MKTPKWHLLKVGTYDPQEGTSKALCGAVWKFWAFDADMEDCKTCWRLWQANVAARVDSTTFAHDPHCNTSHTAGPYECPQPRASE